MAYGYLKDPVEQHKDIKLAVSVLFCKDGKAMVHSRLSDKTFEIDAASIYFKAEPNLKYSEYVTNPPEEKIKLGEDPIFPSREYGNTGTYGISKRLYIATKIMQGLCSSLQVSMTKSIAKMYVSDAYMIADEILKREEK